MLKKSRFLEMFNVFGEVGKKRFVKAISKRRNFNRNGDIPVIWNNFFS